MRESEYEKPIALSHHVITPGLNRIIQRVCRENNIHEDILCALIVKNIMHNRKVLRMYIEVTQHYENTQEETQT